MPKRNDMMLRFLLIVLIISSIGIASANQEDIEELIDYAKKLSEVENYGNSAILYEKIALHYSNNTDWDNASKYYILAAENYTAQGNVTLAAASYRYAGDCLLNMKDCDSALIYYELSAANYKKYDPDYDDSWINVRISNCKEQSLISGLLLFGIILGLLKFSSKAAFGMGFAKLSMKEILAIASLYFILPLLICIVIAVSGELLYTWLSRLFEMKMVLGLFQFVIAISLLTLGLYTIRKWNQKSDVSRKTFLLMAVPCPVSLATMFLTCAFLMITGMKAINAGLLVGGIFFISIIGITTVLRRSRFNKKPSNLGTIMIFFGLLYLLSILLVPAYLPVSEMQISIADFPVDDMIPGFIFIFIMIALGFIRSRIKLTNKGK